MRKKNAILVVLQNGGEELSNLQRILWDRGELRTHWDEIKAEKGFENKKGITIKLQIALQTAIN